jgi:hypothetical protein
MLVDYVTHGGVLIMVGRMCVEDFQHIKYTILNDAIGLMSIQSDPPFVTNYISAFGYPDIPVSFLESYTGNFDEVFAKSKNDEIVGCFPKIGKGKVMLLGASLSANTLDDLDLFHQMT